jgi:tartrate dehydratase alpha subunit/fumarate hydratase class I-like protein
MKLMKNIVEKMGCTERNVYFLGSKADTFNLLPSRGFFREFYDDIKVKFDYHVKLMNSEELEDNNFKIKIKIELDDEHLMDCMITVKFTGSELSSKLSTSYKFEPSDKFNYLVTEKLKSSET